MANRFASLSATDATVPTNLAGHLLIAAPSWENKLFSRTVCLVVHHGAEGAVGVVLNRKGNIDAHGLWQQLSVSEEHARECLLHVGGPNSGPVIALHNLDSHAEFESADGVFVAAQVETLKALVQDALEDPSDHHTALKIIVGQADWEPGQLDEEYASGKWLPLPVSSDLVFTDCHSMWPNAIRKVGARILSEITGIAADMDPLRN